MPCRSAIEIETPRAGSRPQRMLVSRKPEAACPASDGFDPPAPPWSARTGQRGGLRIHAVDARRALTSAQRVADSLRPKATPGRAGRGRSPRSAMRRAAAANRKLSRSAGRVDYGHRPAGPLPRPPPRVEDGVEGAVEQRLHETVRGVIAAARLCARGPFPSAPPRQR